MNTGLKHRNVSASFRRLEKQCWLKGSFLSRSRTSGRSGSAGETSESGLSSEMEGAQIKCEGVLLTNGAISGAGERTTGWGQITARVSRGSPGQRSTEIKQDDEEHHSMLLLLSFPKSQQRKAAGSRVLSSFTCEKIKNSLSSGAGFSFQCPSPLQPFQ